MPNPGDAGSSLGCAIKVYGKKIIGYRAPGAYIGDWMLNSLIKLGFEWKSVFDNKYLFLTWRIYKCQ